MNDTTKNAIESLEEYKKGLLKSIAIAIQTTNGDDDYSVGLRNGLRVCKAYIDGLEPEYEKCKPSAPPNCSESPNGWIPCSERLPNDNDYRECMECLDGAVLYFTKNGAMGLGYYYESTKEWATTDDLRTDGKVIAWMPLPAPYQPKDDES